MNILFFTKSKPQTCKILQVLNHSGHSVAVVCKDTESFQGSEMADWCREKHITVYDNDMLYSILAEGNLPPFDLAISNTYGRLIKKPVIDHVKGKIFNVHCAPLPEYKGMFVYNWGIFNGETQWTVTAHYVNERFDEGDIIVAKSFSMDPFKITVAELEQKSQIVAAELTLSLVERFAKEEKIVGVPQRKNGHYYSRKDFEDLKKVTSKDSAPVIQKKIRACFCPPYEGAYWEHDGARFYFALENTCEEKKNDK